MDIKFAIVIDETLPNWLVANTAAVLSLSIGAMQPALIGNPITDASDVLHPGITTVPILILAATPSKLHEIANSARENKLELVDFTTIARSIHSYPEYEEALQKAAGDYEYLGIAILGDKKAVNRLTGSLPRLK